MSPWEHMKPLQRHGMDKGRKSSYFGQQSVHGAANELSSGAMNLCADHQTGPPDCISLFVRMRVILVGSPLRNFYSIAMSSNQVLYVGGVEHRKLSRSKDRSEACHLQSGLGPRPEDRGCSPPLEGEPGVGYRVQARRLPNPTRGRWQRLRHRSPLRTGILSSSSALSTSASSPRRSAATWVWDSRTTCGTSPGPSSPPKKPRTQIATPPGHKLRSSPTTKLNPRTTTLRTSVKSATRSRARSASTAATTPQTPRL